MTAPEIASERELSLSRLSDKLIDGSATDLDGIRDHLSRYPLDAGGYQLLARAFKQVSIQNNGGVTIRSQGSQAALMQAGRALENGDLPLAEALLRARLMVNPSDPNALRMLAALADQIGEVRDAEALLRLCLEYAPDFLVAQLELAAALHRRNKPEQALELLDRLLERVGPNLPALQIRAAALVRAGRFEEAVDAYQQLLSRWPSQASAWMHYGNLLRTLGRTEDAISAQRKALALSPTLGEAWWALADLKVVEFSRDDLTSMVAALHDDELNLEGRVHLHLALGKAYEDAKEYGQAFSNYAAGNRLRREVINYDPSEVEDYVSIAAHLHTTASFEARAGEGFPAPDPIFIVGMPRAGSTLVEQILASHPAVEGTMELPELLELAREIGGRLQDYGARVPCLTATELHELGRSYIERTRRYRRTLDRPFFVDKMPNNWMHVPLIQLALPNAKIIDARRHPLACCWSNYKQLFIGGQTFTYDLSELGRYYGAYVQFMQRIDTVLPGRVHRVNHEALIEQPEQQVRAMLDYLGLPFDARCLRFHETKRIVRSASSEQVRQPLNRNGVDQWRPFEPWLDPLKVALGPVLDSYPDAPPSTK